MKFLLYTTKYGKAGSIQLSAPLFWVPATAAMLMLLLAAAASGYYAAGKQATSNVVVPTDTQWLGELEKQRAQLVDVQGEARNHLNALAVRIGQIQAQMLRVEALGQRLTKVAKLDKGEFDFDQPPAQGGPAAPEIAESLDATELLQVLDELQAQISDRERQLEVLGQLAMDRDLSDSIRPAGRPIGKGWLSSYYGMRTDPFHGRKEMHKGIDFAGKNGSDVLATAQGVVTWAGKRSGYGLLVEINHGNGYTTRYGHFEKLLVKTGDKVLPAQKIGLMGSSGRSTGPHVHYEVLRNGKQINPTRYVNASR